MLVSDLLIKIGVDADTSKLAGIDKAFKNLAKGAAVMGAAIAGAGAGVAAFVKSNLEDLDAIAQLSRVTGESAKEIQLYGKIAETAGSSTQAAQSSIENLSRTIGEAANGVGLGARAFENYGLSAKKANGDVKSATEVMEELREKMRGMSEQQQIAMLAKLGIDKSMIQTLRLTNEEFEKARANAEALSLGTATKESVDEAAALQDSLTEVGQMVKAVGEFIAIHLSPYVREAVGAFKEWFVVNNQLIKDGLKKFVEKLAGFFKFVSGIAEAINHVISKTVGWKVALGAIAAVMGIIAAQSVIAFAPFYAGAAAIAAVIALVDDLLTYMEGGESLFGSWWDPIITGGKFAWEQIKAIWQIIEGLAEVFTGAFTLDDKTLIKGFKKIFDGLKNIFKNIFSVFSSPFLAAFDFVQQKFDSFINYITSGSSLFSQAWELMAAGGRLVIKQFKAIWKIVEGLSNIIIGAFTLDEAQILKGFNAVLGGLKAIFKGVFNIVSKPFIKAFDFVKQKFEAFIKPIKDGINWVLEKVGIKSKEKPAMSKEELDKVRKEAYSDVPGAPPKNESEADRKWRLEGREGTPEQFAEVARIQAEKRAKEQAMASKIATTGQQAVKNSNVTNKTATTNINTNISVSGVSNPQEVAQLSAEKSTQAIQNASSNLSH